jgi:hypothetical protein
MFLPDFLDNQLLGRGPDVVVIPRNGGIPAEEEEFHGVK